MILDTLSTNFVNFINYNFLVFVIMLITTGIFLSYPFLRNQIEDEEKNEKVAMVFSVGVVISVLMTLMCLLVMIVTPIYAMFNDINIIEFIKVAFSIVSYTNNNRDEIELFYILVILIVNFSIIAWISSLIIKFWGNKIFLKSK